ncbi:MAG: helix-turn-helix domain-containing protein [Coriobacteriales bacterium]|nr:helix-turn-helix domain-containing protein [Coriobacteriales bacterium]
MEDTSFGDRLAAERIRRGLTLEQVSATLRIRPAILKSFETSDFYHMPLKGHARNMVSSYARYLGLDSTELTGQFLREYHVFEEGEARRDDASLRSAVTGYHGVRDSESTVPRSNAPRTRSSQRRTVASRSQGVRSIWHKATPTSSHQAFENNPTDREQNSAASSSRRRTTAGAAAPSQRSRSGFAARNASDATPRELGTERGRSYLSGRKSFPARILGAIFKSPVSAIVALVVLLVFLLVLWALLANSCAKKSDEMISASGGAVVTESEALDPNTGLEIPDLGGDLLADTRYGPFQLAVEPAAGSTPWTEVLVDGEGVFSGMLDARMTWEVTDYCTISTGQPGNLTVTRGDLAVELETDENGLGEVRLEVEERPANNATTNTPNTSSEE